MRFITQVVFILFLSASLLLTNSCKHFSSDKSNSDIDTTFLRTIIDSMEVERKSGKNCNYCDSAVANFNDTFITRKYPELVLRAYQKTILCHWKTKNFLGKLSFNHQFDQLARKAGNDTLMAMAYLWEGGTLFNIGNKQIAYPLLVEALRISKRINHNEITYKITNLLELYAADSADYEKQLALARTRLANPLNKHGYCEILFYMSKIFSDDGKPDSALHYGLKYLEQSIAKDHRVDSATALLAIARYSYAVNNNIPAASIYMNEAKKLLESGKYNAIADEYISLAKLNLQFGELNEAQHSLHAAELLLKTPADSALTLPELYKTYIELNRLRSNIEGMNRYNLLHQKSVVMKQKHLDAEDEKVIMQVYEYGKKELEIAQEEQQKAFAKAEELKAQERQKYLILAATLILLIFAFLIFKNYLNQKKARQQSDALNIELQIKNNYITESIRYALRIQTAILPPEKLVKEYLNNSFVLYLPKDIVAGDFYWVETINNAVLFAACDCTGHGVPGAMVSVMCHNALNRAVREYGLTTPASILDKAVEMVQDNFTKSESEIQDGMDTSFCAYYPEKRILQWSGANNPLWIVRNGEIIEYKPDKQHIGKFEFRKPYTNHEIMMQQGDCIYVFTDGYTDQFGEGKKKLTKKRFKDILLSIQDKTMQNQREELIIKHLDWKGNTEQIDDICVIGVKVQ